MIRHGLLASFAHLAQPAVVSLVTFPQLVRQALERELAPTTRPARRLACVGVISTNGEAGRREYEPDAWR